MKPEDLDSAPRRLFGLTSVVLCMVLLPALVGFAEEPLRDRRIVDSAGASYEQDLDAYKRIRTGLFRLRDEIRRRDDLFGVRVQADSTLLRPDIRQQIVVVWYSVLDNYLALDQLAEKYAEFYVPEDTVEQTRRFHLRRAVFLTQYRLALEIIEELEQNKQIDTILNEASPQLGLPGGLYARFKYHYLNVVKAGHYAALEAVSELYGPEPAGLPPQWAEDDSRVVLDAGKGPGPMRTVKNGLAIIKRWGHSAWFPVQKEVAQWLGRTKVWRPHSYLIQPEQIRAAAELLEPGDILLERREWYMTNVGIPGFWTHAALYIGGEQERKRFSARPEVRDWLNRQGATSLDALIKARYPGPFAALRIPDSVGRLPRIIEALAPGVSLTALEHSAHCDSLAVLRPRLSAADRAAAVVRAMRYYGRPYDYEFDFNSDSSLVCTELIFKSYLPSPMKNGLELPLENLLGHVVMPANEFARLFDQTYGTPEQQFDLVLFLDGDEKGGRAVTAREATFRRSWRRPKWHILISADQAGRKRH